MSPEPTCPDCGVPLPADAPRGLCPNCLMNAARSRSATNGPGATAEVTVAFEPAGSSSSAAAGALVTLAETLGGIPQVLLRDTEGASGVEPLVQPASPEMPSLADRSARLQLFGEIARGGMGAILKGRDADLGRDLAVKVLLEKHRNQPDLVRRFVEEAQIAGQLQHPGIAPVYELGTFADHRPFFTMKLVKGRTLAAVLADRGDPAEDLMGLLATLLQVGQTVAYAHARGVIHRDLKPSNVMLGSFGEVQVMDWGLAKVLPKGGAADDADAGRDGGETVITTARTGADADRSHAGSVLGTPAYMAPEQARGEVENVNGRADVFALGSMLCEVLTGHPAFTGRSSAEIQRKAARGDLADAFSRLDDCTADAELIALAKECLAAERDDRPRDASAFVARLSGYLTSIEQRLRDAELERAAETARAEEAQARVAVERSRRRRTVALAASLLAMTLLGGGSAVWYGHQRQARLARVDGLLREVAMLCDQAEQAPIDDPGAWQPAHVALGQAREVVGDRPGAEIKARLQTLEDRLVRAEAVRRLVERLASIRGEQIEHDSSWANAEYAKAFRDFGLEPDAADQRTSWAAVTGHPASVEIAAALVEWGLVRRGNAEAEEDPSWRRLVEAAQLIDPDPWRSQLRGLLWRQREAALDASVKAMADDVTKVLDEQPAASLVLLAKLLRNMGEHDRSADVLRAAWSRFPGDYWVNFELGDSSWTPRWALDSGGRYERPEEAIRFTTAAVAIRPSVAAMNALGNALSDQKRYGEAVAVFRAAIRLHPDHAYLQNNLGLALSNHGELDEAIAAYSEAIRLEPEDAKLRRNLVEALRKQEKVDEAIAGAQEAIRLEPDEAESYNSLGTVLIDQGERLDEAIAAYREAIRLNPGHAYAQYNLGLALIQQGNLDHAADQFRVAIQLVPDFTEAHYDLGNALRLQVKLDEAIDAFRAAIRHQPDYAEAHCNLGHTLIQHGLPAEGLDALRRGHELGSQQPDWDYPSAEWIRYAERQVALAKRLPAVLRGEDRPTDAAERTEFALVAYYSRQYAASAQLWAEAMAADPTLADERRTTHRYNASCAAALAAAGKGEDDPPPDDAAKAALRQQALDWLKSGLAVWSEVLDPDDPESRSAVAGSLRHWQADPDLAGVREPDALAALPEPERTAWRALWANVDELLNRAE